ncbi:MAG: hypothetical protein RUDDFDWM_001954 [Candidatus Fervidibacterota bacterium]
MKVVQRKLRLSFDSMMICAVCAEAEKKICGGRVKRAVQIDDYDVALKVASASYDGWFIISAHPKYAHMCLRGSLPDGSQKQQTSFNHTLKRFVENSIIRAIEQIEFDRLVKIELETRNELGDKVSMLLMVELMGKHSNIVLVKHDGKIVDALKRLPKSINRYREVLPSKVYVRPPSHGRTNPLTVCDGETLHAMLPSECMKLREWLMCKFHGMSEVLVFELLHRANMSGEEFTCDISGESFRRLLGAFMWLRDVVCGRDFNSVRIVSKDGSIVGCYPIQLEHLQTVVDAELVEQVRCESFSDCVSEWICCVRSRDELKQLKESLKSSLCKILRSLEGRIEELKAKLSEASKADEWRLKGELLLAHAHEIEQGCESVLLDDFSGNKVLVELDPKLSPVENAQRFFGLYKKLKNARESLPSVIEKLEAMANSARKLIAEVELQSDISSLKRLKEQAEQLLSVKLAKALTHHAEVSSTSSDGFLRFKVAGLFDLFVGRNAHENIKLLTELANPNDVWMHVRGSRGAHGLLRRHSRDVEFTMEAIEEAARIVAIRSGCSGKVSVDYTLAKYVRPVKGKHGMVVYRNQKTVVVDV